MVGATAENICMVEGESSEVSENEIIEALKIAHEAIKKMCDLQLKLSKLVGISDKREYSHEDTDEDLLKDIHYCEMAIERDYSDDTELPLPHGFSFKRENK